MSDAVTREEQYYRAMLGEGTAPIPITRKEKWLKRIADAIANGGTGGGGASGGSGGSAILYYGVVNNEASLMTLYKDAEHTILVNKQEAGESLENGRIFIARCDTKDGIFIYYPTFTQVTKNYEVYNEVIVVYSVMGTNIMVGFN